MKTGDQNAGSVHTLKDYLSLRVPFSQELFEKGDPAFAPVLSVEWSVFPAEGETRRLMRAAKQAGFGTVYIIPLPKEFRPDSMVTELDGYLTPAFFEKIKTALGIARGEGLRRWLYDEGGWPSGSACGLGLKNIPEARPGRLRRDENGRPVIKEQGGLKPDVYNADAARFFTEITHRAYAGALGDEAADIDVMFTDETAGDENTVSPELMRAFEEKYGYPLSVHFDALLDPDNADADGRQARRDYYDLLGERFIRTMEILRQASNENGWLLAGHLDRDHTADANVKKGYGNMLAALKSLDIPGVDAIGGQILSSGNRMDGEALPFFPRFASSAAVQKGSPLALSESFAVYGNALSGDEIRFVLNDQLVRGVDLFNFMIMPCTLEGPYAYGERPYFHPDIPGFFALDGLLKTLERECLFMGTGVAAAQTALWYPHADIITCGETGRRAIAAFRAAGAALEAAGEDFDLIDADTVLAAELKNGRLVSGGAAYSRIVIPEGVSVPAAAAEKIAGTSGTARRYVETAEKAFLHRAVRDKNGDLHICIFNGSWETKTAAVRISSGAPVYLCDPASGEMRRFASGDGITLCYGECALLLCSRAEIRCAPELRPRQTLPLDLLSAEKTAEYVLTKNGGTLRKAGGAITASADGCEFPEGFCGEAEFSYSFRSDGKAPCRLSLGALRYFAEVFVNGRRAGSLCAAPYALTIPPSCLREGENKLTLKIANLAATAYAQTDAAEFFEKKYIGPYHAPALESERKMTGGGFSGLKIETPAG